MNISITATVDKQLIDKGVKDIVDKHRDYSHFHPSEWSKCHRQIAYNYYYHKGLISVDKENLRSLVDGNQQRIFGVGHTMHDRWRSYIEQTGALLGVWKNSNNEVLGDKEKLGVLKPKYGIWEYQEKGFYDPETWWGGHVDCIIDVFLFRKYTHELFAKDVPFQGNSDEKVVDKYLIIDFKTINPKQFMSLTCPLPSHITQMQIYLYLSGLKYGKFIYEDKWTQSTKEYLVVRDDNYLAIEKERALHLKKVLTYTNENGHGGFLPPRGYETRTHKECLRCKFRGHCWKDLKNG